MHHNSLNLMNLITQKSISDKIEEGYNILDIGILEIHESYNASFYSLHY